ncbi:PIN domain-containing protein [Pseudomonas orientalis]|uniref:PIN domain-containing protein n=1 Tax=Pseudomonas orientalis TaxID=76758 RepID=UPI003208E5F6
MEKTEVEFVLRSKVLFIDTSIYFGNNFQFLTKDLESLSRLLNSGEITLLFTTVTIAEINRHLKAESNKAVSAAQSFQTKGKILRNLSVFSSSIMFGDVDSRAIEAELLAQFASFMSALNIETVSLELASVEEVFERYFSVLPPFSEKKPTEFRDAFVLGALKAYAVRNDVRIHVLSDDKDMQDFCVDDPNLFWSDKLGEFLNAAVHAERGVPAIFADKAFAVVNTQVFSLVETYLNDQDFGVLQESGYSYRHTSCGIQNIVAVNRRILYADRSSARFAIDYEFEVQSVYLRSEPVSEVSGGQHTEIHRWEECYKKVVEVTADLKFFEGDVNSVVLDDWDFRLPSGDILWEDERISQVTTKS